MSRIAFVGALERSWRILQLLISYETMTTCDTNISEWLAQVDSSYDASIPSHQLLIENKYYTAQLSAHLFPSSWNPSTDDDLEYEAIVIIEDDVAVESDPFKEIGGYVSDRSLALCVRIFYQEDESCLTDTARENLVLWSIDHGFEFIEVYNSSLFQDVKARDKNGLPRVMEALQSVIWSSMKKVSKLKSATVESAVTIDNSSFPPPPPQLNETVVITEAAEESHYLLLKENGEQVDNTENEDEKLLDTFASALEHAHIIRDQAIRGEISDQERRDNAAALAMKLMEMMGMDDDSDGD
jgi:hypothetical protein